MEQIALEWSAGPRVLSVSELTAEIGGVLAAEFGSLWVSGEISGCRQPASGHYYFTLKDKEAQLSAVCYKGTARFLRFKPRDGVAVLARGRLDVWPPQGKYQLVVEALEPQGYGALQFEFEQLKKKLAMEGLFDASRKRPLPEFPMRIGLVTSPTGAVIQDILNILSRRFPGLHIRLYPALVQGEGSVEAVCRGLQYFGAGGWAQVVIVARGGGSLEDLWTFNDERVARAIAESPVPVISAIGHETDFTIADFVADLRAPTPSAAAELVICTREQLLDRIAGCRRKLEQAARYRIMQSARTLHRVAVDSAAAALHRSIARRSQRLDELDFALRDRMRAILDSRRRGARDVEMRMLRRDPRVRLGQWQQRVLSARHRLGQKVRDDLAARSRRLSAIEARLRRADPKAALTSARHGAERAHAALVQRMLTQLAIARNRLALAETRLDQLSPLKVLERGYAIVQTAAGAVVKSAADASPGTEIRVRVADGRLAATVTEATPGGSSEPLS